MCQHQKYKALLRAVLNAGITGGASAKQTKEALDIQFNAICLMCIVECMGHCPCDKGYECFVEKSLSVYKNKADQKCQNNNKK